ncbi:KxYKxGKxW signal peptide domain-containing protein [Helicobacter pylori]
MFVVILLIYKSGKNWCFGANFGFKGFLGLFFCNLPHGKFWCFGVARFINNNKVLLL